MSCCAKPIRKSRQIKYREIYDKYKRFLIEEQNFKNTSVYLSSSTYTICNNYKNDTSSETIKSPYEPIYHYKEEFTKEEIRILKNIYHVII